MPGKIGISLRTHYAYPNQSHSLGISGTAEVPPRYEGVGTFTFTVYYFTMHTHTPRGCASPLPLVLSSNFSCCEIDQPFFSFSFSSSSPSYWLTSHNASSPSSLTLRQVRDDFTCHSLSSLFEPNYAVVVTLFFFPKPILIHAILILFISLPKFTLKQTFNSCSLH